MMRVLSLFAGIGGFDLGLERTGGFKTVAVAELDPYASAVLAKRFPNAPNVGDVTTAEYPDADIICAGFPCQDISFAGAGAGLAGSRSGLWREVVRAIRVVRPRYALLENVAALLGRGLDTVLGDLAEVGHDAEWHCIPAAAVGAPHRRDRIWIVTHPRGEQYEVCRAPLSGEIAAELSRAASDTASMFRTAVERGEPDGNHACAREVADADGAGLEGRNGEELRQRAGERAVGSCCTPVADAESFGLEEQRLPTEGGEVVAKPAGSGRCGEHSGCSENWWGAEPNVGRVADGIPRRVDRLRCLGNAVVPQIPELIGRAILEAERIAA